MDVFIIGTRCNMGHSHYDPSESIVTDVIANVHHVSEIHKDHTKRKRSRIFLLLLTVALTTFGIGPPKRTTRSIRHHGYHHVTFIVSISLSVCKFFQKICTAFGCAHKLETSLRRIFQYDS